MSKMEKTLEIHLKDFRDFIAERIDETLQLTKGTTQRLQEYQDGYNDAKREALDIVRGSNVNG